MGYRLINDDKGILNVLIEKLNKYDVEGMFIPEIYYLPEFGGTDELSVQGFSPRWIIQDMIKKYKCAEEYVTIRTNIQKFCYVHVNVNEHKICEYTFTNTMTFHFDIYILCYLYFLISRCGLDKQPSVMELMKIMQKKYEIKTKLESVTGHEEIVTLSRIANSYPSITMEIFKHNIESTASFLCTVFPNFHTLSPIICSPTIASLLPPLAGYPMAVLIAIAVLLENHSGLHKKTSLTIIYLHVLRSYNSTVFPESLKYLLCREWNIISENNGNYSYPPAFEHCREIAIDLITEMRKEESDLEFLLPLL